MSKEMSRAVLAKVQEKMRNWKPTPAQQKRAKERLDADRKALDAQIEARPRRSATRSRASSELSSRKSRRSNRPGRPAPKQILTDTSPRFQERFGRAFRAGIGAEAVRELLSRIELQSEMYRCAKSRLIERAA